MTDPTYPPELPEPAPEPAPVPQPPVAAKQPVLSIISLISGLLGVLAGLVGGGSLFSIGGVVLGHLGQRREPAAKGFWLTGLVTGYVGLLVNVVVIVLWIVFFALLANSGDFNDYRDFYNYR